MPRRDPERKRVRIVGGGFAGAAAAPERSPDRPDVILIDRRRWHEFLPDLDELLSGVKRPEPPGLLLEPKVRRAGGRESRHSRSAEPE